MAEETKAQATDQTKDEPEEESVVPDLELARKIFLLEYYVRSGDADPEGAKSIEKLKKQIVEQVESDGMGAFYETTLSSSSGSAPALFPADPALVKRLTDATAAKAKELEEQKEDAEKNQGETEVLDALFAVAKLWARAGDKEKAYAAYDAILAMPKVGSSKKLDAQMARARVALFHMDLTTLKGDLEECSRLNEAGGDWDRRNRLKVYQAFYHMATRNLKKAADLLLDCLATFTALEVCSYELFVQYAAITTLLSQKRPTIKEKIIDGPEVLGVIGEMPAVRDLVNSLYDCDYGGFFKALVEVHGVIGRDRVLAQHRGHIVRELRILAYAQFLEAYKSVRLSSMAATFGVSPDFLDRELSRFIASGRLHAKIDKVAGVVETWRGDAKNAQYAQVVKKGDVLLNAVQRLARLTHV
uniref:PCI domain-containing protein n=1 Tax=Fibrocapsa japonica TaxID=94617 RepID=A0A7S2V782_9STRA